MTTSKAGIKKADWIAKIVSDPNNPPNVVMITGFFGDSSVDAHVRIYLNSDLSGYVDVPENAVRHTEDIPGDQAPPGASYIWLDRDAEVIHEPIAKPQPRRAKFLQGRVEQMYARRALAQPQLNQAASPQPQFFPSQVTLCRSEIDGCPSALIECESQLNFCNPTVLGCQPSRFTICMSTGIRCLSVIDDCRSALIECESQFNICASAFVGCAPSRFVICQSGGIRCPSAIDDCPSALIECSSQNIGCITQGPACPNTIGAICATIDCPSIVDGCPSTPGGCDWDRWGDWRRRIGGRGLMRPR